MVCRSPTDRLPAADLARMLKVLRAAGIPVRDETAVTKALTELRELYEAFVNVPGELLPV